MNRLLIGFVRKRIEAPGIEEWLYEGGEDIDGFTLAVWAGVMPENEATDLRKQYYSGYSTASAGGVHAIDLVAVVQEMVERDLLRREVIEQGEHIPRRPLTLTPAGIDLGLKLLRPWYVKMWDFMKGDARAIIVAAITTVLTALALKLLSWI